MELHTLLTKSLTLKTVPLKFEFETFLLHTVILSQCLRTYFYIPLTIFSPKSFLIIITYEYFTCIFPETHIVQVHKVSQTNLVEPFLLKLSFFRHVPMVGCVTNQGLVEMIMAL